MVLVYIFRGKIWDVSNMGTVKTKNLLYTIKNIHQEVEIHLILK